MMQRFKKKEKEKKEKLLSCAKTTSPPKNPHPNLTAHCNIKGDTKWRIDVLTNRYEL